MDKILPYLSYLLIGFSFYIFCVELEEFDQEIWKTSLVLIIDFVLNVVFALKGYFFRRYWFGLAWVTFVSNFFMWNIETLWNIVTPGGVLIVFRRILNSILFANFGALAPSYVLGIESHRTDMVISVFQASFIVGFLLALIICNIFTLSLSSLYMLSSFLYLIFAFKFQNLSENPGVQVARPLFSLIDCKQPVLNI